MNTFICPKAEGQTENIDDRKIQIKIPQCIFEYILVGYGL